VWKKAQIAIGWLLDFFCNHQFGYLKFQNKGIIGFWILRNLERMVGFYE
jgi:hypothetical protein